VLCFECDPEFEELPLRITLDQGVDGSFEFGFTVPESTTSTTVPDSTTSTTSTTVPESTTTLPYDPYAGVRAALPGYSDAQYQSYLDAMADLLEIRIIVPASGAESDADEVIGRTHIWTFSYDNAPEADPESFVVSYAATTTTSSTIAASTTSTTSSTVPLAGILPATGSDRGTLAMIAALLLGAGMLARMAARRRLAND